MNRLIAAFSVLILTFSMGSAQEKLNLTREQLVRFPKGITCPLPYVQGWQSADELILYRPQDGKMTPSCYQVKTGKYTACTPEKTGTALPLPEIEGARNVTFSPDRSMVAYTRDNDLYYRVLSSGKEHRVTRDGSELILNGYASWVYYEEILGRPSKYKAFWWSPDSRKIAFYRFDNTKVPMFPIYEATGQEGSLSRTRYPKAGAVNPEVKIGIADLNAGDRIVWGDFDEKKDQYFGIPFWSSTSETFIVPWMPRVQNNMIIYALDYRTGEKSSIYSEKQSTWIDWPNEALFTDEGMYMVRDYEMWQQIYFLSYDGARFEKLTQGKNWGISILKLDERKDLLFYSARNEEPTRNDVFMVHLKTGKTDRISFGAYNFTDVRIAPDSRKYTAVISNVATPSRLVLVDFGKRISHRVLADSKGPDFDKYKLARTEIVKIETPDGYVLPASVTYPVDLDRNRKYPVIYNIYGGPDAPGVFDRWSEPSFNNQWWANEGVIVARIDCRTAGHSGKKGMNCAYENLGEVELSDFVLWARYFNSLPFVNAQKTGITGFSYGGTMTARALFCANDYFKYGIAGGGVYDWALYDTHYTERYMNTPQNNPEGYKNSAVLTKVAGYKGDASSMIRLTHGTSDDNVHFQNTLQMIDALQKENKIFELMVYPGGFHGYRGYQGVHSRKEDMIFWYKYLLETTPPGILMSR